MLNLQSWISRETWETMCLSWQIFPVIVAARHLFPYSSTKPPTARRTNPPSTLQSYLVSALTSLPSAFIILYLTAASPFRPLPVGNWTMVVLYTVYSIYRAFLSPAPSTLKLSLNACISAPDEILTAVVAQVLCGLSLGGWLGGYGKSSEEDWSGMVYTVEVGLVTWGWAFLATIFHEDELRPWVEYNSQLVPDRVDVQKEKQQEQEGETKPERPRLPRSYLFKYILYPHFLFPLIMWAGFWFIGGWDCRPARSMLVYEISTTVTRALQGRRECMRVFDAKEVENRWVFVPGIF